MATDWTRVKYEFGKFIADVSHYEQFEAKMFTLTTNSEKGIFFEYFCKLYFILIPSNKALYKKFKLYSEISQKKKDKHHLPIKDKGIDAIVKKGDEICAIQIKFRSNTSTIIPFGEIATFQALTFGTDVRYITSGIFFTNCCDVCDELKNDKYYCITYDCFDKCDELFWKNVREYIGERPLTIYKQMQPLPYQTAIIEKIRIHYEHEQYGRLYLPCGTGKTFLGYWTFRHILNASSVFIVVPSLYLLSETYEFWQREMQYDVIPSHFILIGSDIDKMCEYTPTTCLDNIVRELKKERKRVVIITTYHSSSLLVDACKILKYQFDLGIYDEAHRSVGEITKQFTSLLNAVNISKRRLFMTATERIYHGPASAISMDNEKIYGKIIHNYSTRMAIVETKDKPYGLVDYKLIAPYTTDNSPIAIARMILTSMDEYRFTHLLIFSNQNKRAKELIELIELLIEKDATEMYERMFFGKQTSETTSCMNRIRHFLGTSFASLDPCSIYCKYLSGNDTMTVRKSEVQLFEKAPRGIISSARIFGEGVNIKICDAICFADNKYSSIDIIQCVGRCLRKCEDIKPGKISYVLTPFVIAKCENYYSEENDGSKSLQKILKTLGTTDEKITENFILINYDNRGISHRRERVCTEYSVEIDVEIFRGTILTRVFDRKGNAEHIWRNVIIGENKRRYGKKITELIDTKTKCLEFLKEKRINVEPLANNWVRFCLGNVLFEKIKERYYYTNQELLQACRSLNINTFAEYKKEYSKDPRLPSIDYINNGFYIDMDPKFNLTLLLNSGRLDFDF